MQRRVVFHGIRVETILEGYSPSNPVRNIRFEDLSINVRIISDTMSGKPGCYRTADFANLYVGANVSSITFTD